MNSSFENSSDISNATPGRDIPVVFWCFLLPLDLVIIASNVLLLFVLAKERRLRVRSCWYVVSLSICDLLAGLTVPPCEYCAVNTEQGVCQVLCGSAVSFNQGASVVNVCLITVDRVMAVFFPYKYQSEISTRKIITNITIGWIVCFAITLLPLSWLNMGEGRDRFEQAYGMAMFGTVIMIGVVLAIADLFLIRKARMMQKSIIESIPITNGQQAKVTRSNGVRVCVLLAITYMICWFPQGVMEASKLFNLPLKNFPTLWDISYIALLFNSALDPYLMVMYRKDFRYAISKHIPVLRRFKCCGLSHLQPHMNDAF